MTEHVDFVGSVVHFPVVKGQTSSKGFHGEFLDNVLNKDLIYTGVCPKALRERYNVSDVVRTHPDNRQSIASFLGEYYSPADLRKFFDTFGGSFKHLEKVTKVIGPKNGPPGTEASLDIQYIMSLRAMVPTWIWSTAGRHESKEPFLEWLMDISNRSEVPWVHSVSFADFEDSLDVAYMNRINVEFQKAGLRGLTFLFASGDYGAACKIQNFGPCSRLHLHTSPPLEVQDSIIRCLVNMAMKLVVEDSVIYLHVLRTKMKLLKST